MNGSKSDGSSNDPFGNSTLNKAYRYVKVVYLAEFELGNKITFLTFNLASWFFCSETFKLELQIRF